MVTSSDDSYSDIIKLLAFAQLGRPLLKFPDVNSIKFFLKSYAAFWTLGSPFSLISLLHPDVVTFMMAVHSHKLQPTGCLPSDDKLLEAFLKGLIPEKK